jgi:hypothetical protein
MEGMAKKCSILLNYYVLSALIIAIAKIGAVLERGT